MHLSSQADRWVHSGFVCHQGEAQQPQVTLVSTFKVGGSEEQCPLKATVKEVSGTSLPL